MDLETYLKKIPNLEHKYSAYKMKGLIYARLPLTPTTKSATYKNAIDSITRMFSLLEAFRILNQPENNKRFKIVKHYKLGFFDKEILKGKWLKILNLLATRLDARIVREITLKDNSINPSKETLIIGETYNCQLVIRIFKYLRNLYKKKLTYIGWYYRKKNKYLRKRRRKANKEVTLYATREICSNFKTSFIEYCINTIGKSLQDSFYNFEVDKLLQQFMVRNFKKLNVLGTTYKKEINAKHPNIRLRKNYPGISTLIPPVEGKTYKSIRKSLGEGYATN